MEPTDVIAPAQGAIEAEMPDTLADPTQWDRAAARLGPAAELTPYMVAVDRATGKAIDAWKGTQRRQGFGRQDVVQLPALGKNAAQAKRDAEVQLAQQGGRDLPTLPPAPPVLQPGPVTPPPPKDKATDPSWFRQDGSEKGQGFLGPMTTPTGKTMSELSIADSAQLKDALGHYQDYPTLVPTLTHAEVETLRTLPEGAPVPEAIVKKATAYAEQRAAEGKPLFARTGERPPRNPQ